MNELEEKNIKLYQAIARKLNWKPTAEKFIDQRNWQINALEHELPSGSGLDYPASIDRENFTENKFSINGSYHYMNELGYYAGWIKFRIVISACLQYGYSQEIELIENESVEEDNFIEETLFDYISDVYNQALDEKKFTDKEYQKIGLLDNSTKAWGSS